jgi:hypothetical protein
MGRPNYEIESTDSFIAGAEERANRNAVKPDDLAQIGNRVPKELRRRLKQAALENDTTINAILITSLEAWLVENDTKRLKGSALEDDGL